MWVSKPVGSDGTVLWHGRLPAKKHLSEGQSKLRGTSGFEKQLLVMFAGESCWDFSFFFQCCSSYRANRL